MEFSCAVEPQDGLKVPRGPEEHKDPWLDMITVATQFQVPTQLQIKIDLAQLQDGSDHIVATQLKNIFLYTVH
jgi:hypothetical protein